MPIVAVPYIIGPVHTERGWPGETSLGPTFHNLSLENALKRLHKWQGNPHNGPL